MKGMENTPQDPGPVGHEGLGHAKECRRKEMPRKGMENTPQGPGPDGHEGLGHAKIRKMINQKRRHKISKEAL